MKAETVRSLKKLKRRLFGVKSVSEVIVYSIVFIIFTFFAFTYLYVLVWCFLAGLKTNTEIVLQPFALPQAWKFSNYIEVLELLEVNDTTFFEMVLISIYFSVLGPAISLTFTSMVSYVATKYKFKGCESFYIISLIMILLPIYGSGGAQYRLIHDLGLINNPLQVLTSASGFGANFLYFYACYKSLSWSYAEAAFIDGANDFQVYFKVMLPQIRGLFGALFLLAWIGEWNNYGSALIYLPDLPPLAVGIYKFQLEMTYHVRMDILYAACFISCIPPLVLFVCFTNVLMSNVSLGGIKD